MCVPPFPHLRPLHGDFLSGSREEELQEVKNSPASSHGILAGEKGHTDLTPWLLEDQVSAGLTWLYNCDGDQVKCPLVLFVCLKIHIFFPFSFFILRHQIYLNCAQLLMRGRWTKCFCKASTKRGSDPLSSHIKHDATSANVESMKGNLNFEQNLELLLYTPSKHCSLF